MAIQMDSTFSPDALMSLEPGSSLLAKTLSE